MSHRSARGSGGFRGPGGPAPVYFGSDSDSSSSPQDFYIGKLGAHRESPATEVLIAPSATFNTDAIRPETAVYGYWWLGGPGSDPNWTPDSADPLRARDWGRAQAQAALNAADGRSSSFNGLFFSIYLNRRTLFADVETSTTEPNRWLDPAAVFNGFRGSVLNIETLRGFLHWLRGAGRGIGVYSAPGEWQRIFGAADLPLGVTGVVGWSVGGLPYGRLRITINQYVDDLDVALRLPD